MTAGRVCAEIVSQMKLPRNIDWVLYEVIDDGAMGECRNSLPQKMKNLQHTRKQTSTETYVLRAFLLIGHT